MRLYYFTTAEHALSNIEKRRIKISEVMSLNDPFEFMSINVQDRRLRTAMRKTKAQMAAASGLICFSRNWRHPMMWSHYADRHRGICLGFDVAEQWCCEVTYEHERVVIRYEDIVHGRVDDAAAKKLVSTKAGFWEYEAEVRVFCTTAERDEKGLSFRDFSDDLTLREVIVGPNCNVTRAQIATVLGNLSGSVRRFKSRIAFGYFEVCPNANERLWT